MQAETEGNEFVSQNNTLTESDVLEVQNISDSQSSPAMNCEENLAQLSNEQNLSEVSEPENLLDISDEQSVPEVSSQESLTQISDQQCLSQISVQENLTPLSNHLSSQENLTQISEHHGVPQNSNQENLVHLTDQQSLSHIVNGECLPQVLDQGEPSQLCSQEGLNEITGEEVMHEMAGQADLHHISPPEVLQEMSAPEVITEIQSADVISNISASQVVSGMSDSHTIVADISAPEIRSRHRSQDEDIVLLQSTFTQTIDEKDSKKACHSVAVQTQFHSDFEAPAPAAPTYSVITGDGSVEYDSDGVRVLRAIGTWTPNYQGTEQFVEQNGEVYINTSAAVTSSDNSIIQHAVTTAASTVTNCLPSVTPNRVVAPQNVQQPSQGTANKQPSGDKAFVCPVCNKGLARKDKLVIHMRIHTGEKPYVCEICERAFARRDKLVMHMNKLKHLTPSNIAPLGKRHHPQSTSSMSGLPEKRQEIKLEAQEIGSPASSVDIQPAALVQVVHDQPTMTWNCELCGRICMSRDEWTAHARSHLDGEHNFGTTSVSSSLSVLTPLSSYQYSGSSPDRQTCVVCRQEFPNKTELILHLRGHFVGKPELLANHVASITDPSGVCS